VAESKWSPVDETMPDERSPILYQSGRGFLAEELDAICATVELFPNLTLSELLETVCEHLDWTTASGRSKLTACSSLLSKLEEEGRVRLPRKSARGSGPRSSVLQRVNATETSYGPERSGVLADLGRVELEIVVGRDRLQLWKEYVDRYHDLGYKRPFGCPLHYFVRSDENLLGCVLLAGAAHSIACRDQWIGWDRGPHLQNLPWVVNNSRFLIFPWIRVPNLASHVLGQVARRLRADWEAKWGYQPVLLETFVDRELYRGTCYRAAGWLELGCTTGRGRQRPGKSYRSRPKRVFVLPLVPKAAALLCGADLRKRRNDE